MRNIFGFFDLKFRRAVSLAVLVLFIAAAAAAETPSAATLAQWKAQAKTLCDAHKQLEALPLLERIVAADPNDAQMQFDLGFALIDQATNTSDDAARHALRIRSRAAFQKAVDLGIKEPIAVAMVQTLPPDGSDGRAFSQNRAANDLMNAAEALFSQDKLDEAFNLYQQALKLDPACYEAVLFSADVRSQQGRYAEAEALYDQAIALDPDRETAYRYSATAYWRSGEHDRARDRYVESYITEPYSRFAQAGLQQWAQMSKVTLRNLSVTVPDINFDAAPQVYRVAARETDPAWNAYAQVRSEWRKQKFAQAFPNAKSYRHSLPEEAEALRAAVTQATVSGSLAANPSLQTLKALDDEGLLESFILLQRADSGIQMDFPAYLSRNRDKLRSYVVRYILPQGS